MSLDEAGSIGSTRIDGAGQGANLNVSAATVRFAQGLAIDDFGRAIWINNPAGTTGISSAPLSGNGDGVNNTNQFASGNHGYPALISEPKSVAAPVITGGSTTGSTLTCSTGSWAGDETTQSFSRAPQSYSYRWINTRGVGGVVPGANSSTLTTEEPGSYFCRVTAANWVGSSEAGSAMFVVEDEPAPPVDPVDPVDPLSPVGGTATLGRVTLNKRRGTATIPVTASTAGLLTLSGPKIATQTVEVPAAGDAALTIRPAGKARKQLRKKRRLKVTTSTLFTPVSGDPTTQDLTVKLKRKRKRN
jgi:hypothetical protein